MKLDNDFMRELYLGYTSSKKPYTREDCPSSKAIASSFEPSASRRKKKRIIDHISKCSFCKEEFMLCFELQKYDFMHNKINERVELFPSQARSVATRNSGLSSFWRYAYVLLGLVFIISAISLFVQQKELSKVQRARETGVRLLYPTSKHTLPNTLVFRWQEQPLSQYYILELFDESLLPIWTSPKIYNTQVQLPADIQSKLNYRRSYFWMITAFSDIQEIEESTLVHFIVLSK